MLDWLTGLLFFVWITCRLIAWSDFSTDWLIRFLVTIQSVDWLIWLLFFACVNCRLIDWLIDWLTEILFSNFTARIGARQNAALLDADDEFGIASGHFRGYRPASDGLWTPKVLRFTAREHQSCDGSGHPKSSGEIAALKTRRRVSWPTVCFPLLCGDWTQFCFRRCSGKEEKQITVLLLKKQSSIVLHWHSFFVIFFIRSWFVAVISLESSSRTYRDAFFEWIL